jgi:TusA-related sulfurtransferase
MTDSDARNGEPPARIDAYLDCTGLRCPLPLLRTKQQLNRMPAGAVLEVTATDVGAQRDIPAFLKLSAHRLLGSAESAGKYRFWIERG